ncbi:MAG: aldehyde ferredoxin oxidoreductase family protein, partial [Deltaproteobacteria bacterium]|nr:aldehyde ferredoxin oxidoreductase family protein [Deltaproteobacteria bacterium]
MNGWTGKILVVDLTQGEITEEGLDPRVAKDYIGGRGFGIQRLLREVDPSCDPLSPENALVMAAGPLTGTKAPTGARYMITTKSPLTGSITCSNSGGHFPAELKRAGLDLIVFRGKASEPVYLWVENGMAELRSARHVWGKSTHETDEILRGETSPDARTACIGPAGEKRVLFASVMNDRDRAAGRSGVGAVMGSKNLKAVVVRGTTQVPLHDPKAFNDLVKRLLARFKDSLKGGKHPLNLHGTAITVMATQNFGVLPTRNFQQGTFPGWEEIHGETLTRRFLLRPKACFSCPIGCGRVTRVDTPEFQGEGEGPEYETVYAMGSNCGVNDLAAVTKANYICNEMGLDTISMGSTIACAMELYERGHLPESDIGGPLRFGDGRALVELT